MDINRLGVEATLGYFIASSLAYGLKISFSYYNLNYLILLVAKAVFLIVLLTGLALYKRKNLAELALLTALIIVGVGL